MWSASHRPTLLSVVLLLIPVCVSDSMTITSSLRQKLRQGGKSYGPMIMSDSPIIAELLALVPGYSHLIIDHEHCATDIRSSQNMLRAIQAANSVSMYPKEAIVRVPGPDDPIYLKKALDSTTLPGGILVPMVNNAKTAQAIVNACHYPRQQTDDDSSTDGTRGFAAPLVRASRFGNDVNYMQRCRDDLLIMVQVETPEAVQAIPDIAAIPGVDAIFLGPYDLSTSLGKSGQFDDPEVQAFISHAEQLVSDSGCLLAGFRQKGRSLHDMFVTAGYSLVCGGVDLGMLERVAGEDAESASQYL